MADRDAVGEGPERTGNGAISVEISGLVRVIKIDIYLHDAYHENRTNTKFLLDR